MKHRRQSPGQVLNQFFARASRPSKEQVESSRHSMLMRLGLQRASGIPRPDETVPVSARLKIAVAAAALVALAAGLTMVRNPEPALDSRATVETIEGVLYRVVSRGQSHVVQVGERIESGSLIRSNGGDGSVLALADGSRVEMRSQSELLLERSSDGLRIRLNTGSIIVNAAEQPVQVQTAEVTVSGRRGVFLVNASGSTSQFAVIQGEIQLKDGATLQTSGPRPLAEEIAWSRNASAHMALLQESLAARLPQPAPLPPISAQTEAKTSAPLEFAAVSIRPTANGVPGSMGFACRGADGVRRANFGETSNTLPAPQGRCVGNGVSLARLIRLAYDVPHRYGPDTPDWTRPYTNPTGMPRVPETYQIEAVAENSAAATTGQLIQMLQTMLAQRFQLKFHREMQEVPGYAMVVAKAGAKIKKFSGNEEYPVSDFSTLSSRGGPTLRGKSGLDKLIQFIVAFSNPTGFITSELPNIVIDKTGLTGMYEYEFVLPVPGGGQRGQNAVPQGIPGDRASQSYAWRGPALAEALEDQLGLRLQPERIRIEVIVVDHVERPSPN